jgi:hypothetical protein
MNKEEFIAIKEKWHEYTKLLSFEPDAIHYERWYEELLEAGESILPFIMDDIQDIILADGKEVKSPLWFSFLCKITECNPIPKKHRGQIMQMYHDWMVWYLTIYEDDPDDTNI